MIGKFGSDQQQLADLGGGVISEDGATLLSGESTGEASLLFGPAALREIQAGVANGDFAIPPADAEATITADNALPYWTFTDVNSAGAITCALVADATAGSGKVLRWSVAASTATGKSATLARYVPVASSRNRAFAYIPELNTASATNTANASVTITYQYYKLDYTTTGSSGTSTATFATLGTGTNWMNPAVNTTTATPSDAAFIYVEIKVSTTGTTPASISTVDITEARVIRGDQTNLFAEYTTPATYSPTRMRQVNGVLNIEPNGGTGAVQLGGALNLDTRHTIEPLNTGTVQFTRNDTGNRSSITVGRVFPGTQTTRYIDDNGLQTEVSGALYIGAYSTTGSAANLRATAATGSAILFSTSSRRWKENIEDVDAETLAAAKRLKARHFNSKHEADNHKRLLGMIAEEVEEAGLDCAVEYDDNGLALAIDWNAITAALLARLEDAERRIAELESR
jgi:hypothetical protein